MNNLKSSILEIEKDMERLSENRIIKPEQVVRLVSEYNCQLACGFPIHNLLFQLWHDEIEVLWKHRDAERN